MKVGVMSTDLRWAGAAPGMCAAEWSGPWSEPSARGNKPAGCTSGRTTL